MVSRRFFWNLVIRVLLITLNTGGLVIAVMYLTLEDLFTILLIAGFLVAQVISFVRSYNRINRDLATFLGSVQTFDPNISFPNSLSKRIFGEVYSGMTHVNSVIANLKITLEEQNQYYKTLLDHSPPALISFYSNGKVATTNSAALELFGVEKIRKISDLSTICDKLTDFLLNSDKPVQKVIRTRLRGENVSLMVKLGSVKIRSEIILIAAIQNIEAELIHKENESWHKLLRVITHEIANSIAPISSTIETMSRSIQEMHSVKSGSAELSEKSMNKIEKGVKIIGERSQGLLQLIENVHKFSSLPHPVKSAVDVGQLVKSTLDLLHEEFEENHISVQVESPTGECIIQADEKLIRHVLINMITNAIEALVNHPDKRIMISFFNDPKGTVVIQVEDSGQMVPDEILEKAFIPFYTTKNTGSGIGLSFSREIMRMHGGTIELTSSERGTACLIRM